MKEDIRLLSHPGTFELFRPVRDCLVLPEDKMTSFSVYHSKQKHNSPDPRRNSVVIVPIGCSPKHQNTIDSLEEWLRIYFHLSVYQEKMRFSLERKEKKLSIIDKEALVYFPLKLRKGRVNVMEIFDVIINQKYIPQNAFSVLVVAPFEIFDPCSPDDLITGRAVGGSRAACVSVAKGTKEIDVLHTAAHELLHTFGVDHCTAFECLMNSLDRARGSSVLRIL